MSALNSWTVLAIIAGILLIIFWFGRNAVWGGLTLGVIIGLLVAFFRKHGFEWHIVGKAAILGTLIGFIAELLGMIGDRIRKRF